jgi:hypothetical protein
VGEQQRDGGGGAGGLIGEELLMRLVARKEVGLAFLDELFRARGWR